MTAIAPVTTAQTRGVVRPQQNQETDGMVPVSFYQKDDVRDSALRTVSPRSEDALIIAPVKSWRATGPKAARSQNGGARSWVFPVVLPERLFRFLALLRPRRHR